MCGIAGVVHLGELTPSREELLVLRGCLEHRGPDELGLQSFASGGFVHTRLSIIDLASGSQPMQSSDGNIICTFNGEIFNYRELRQELIASGVVFRTHSDTEVLLEGFARFGVDFFQRLNGQYACAFYNLRDASLVLLRDRMGEKPLYYAMLGSQVVFASELKAIWQWARYKGYALTLAPESFNHFLSLNYVPFESTFFQEIHKLAPAHFLKVERAGYTLQSYWNIAEEHEQSVASGNDLLPLLIDSVRLRTRSDVPMGLFLSGGIDSTVVAQLVASQNAAVKAFIAEFSFPQFSEASRAVQTAKHLGLEHQVIPIDVHDREIPDLVAQLVAHGDEPLADSSALAVYLLSRETARERKVVLSGDGADELFGGYLTYQATMAARYIPQSLRALLALAPGVSRLLPAGAAKVGFREKLDRFLRGLTLPPGAAHFAWNGMCSSAEKDELFSIDFRKKILNKVDTFELLAEKLGVHAQAPSWQQLLRADQRGYLPNDILAKVDRMSMAHGLEVRPVYLDHRLVECANRMPASAKVGLRERKKPLQRYLAREFPGYDRGHLKQGFSIPIHHWFRTSLRQFASDELFSERVERSGIYNMPALQGFWNEHQSGRRDLGFHLWGILVSIIWLKRFEQI